MACESDHWPSVALNDLIISERPICYGVLKPGKWVQNGVPLVRILDIDGDRISPEKMFRIEPKLDLEFARSRLAGGEVLVSIQGTVGRVAIVPEDFGQANISRTIARVHIDPRKADARFIRHYLLSAAGQKLLKDSVIGTTRDSLNISLLRMIPVPLPKLTTQRRIVATLDAHDARIRAEQAELDKLRALKKGLLDDLLTGRVRVPVSTDAPAASMPEE